MNREKKAKKVSGVEARIEEPLKLPKDKKERKRSARKRKVPSILYSFPNIGGRRIAVWARNMQEAVVKAKEEVNKLV